MARDMMKTARLGRFAAALIALAVAIPTYAHAGEAPTRILAIGTINSAASLAAARAILPTEVKETVKLYLEGKIDQWFSPTDRTGVVFLLNMTDPKQAAALLENLPLGRAHLMHFELMPLAPLGPLRLLTGMAGRSP